MQTRKDTLVRQKEIVLAARKLIVKYGSENVTVRKIAKEIGVTEGAIYKHFKSKRDILSLLIDDIENTLISDIDVGCLREINELQVLETILIEHISAIEQRKGVTFQVIAEIISLGDKKLNNKVYLIIQKYIGSIKAILRKGTKAGVIRSDIDLDAAAQMFFSMTQGLVSIWALSHYNFDLVSEYKPAWQIYLKAVVAPK